MQNMVSNDPNTMLTLGMMIPSLNEDFLSPRLVILWRLGKPVYSIIQLKLKQKVMDSYLSQSHECKVKWKLSGLELSWPIPFPFMINIMLSKTHSLFLSLTHIYLSISLIYAQCHRSKPICW